MGLSASHKYLGKTFGKYKVIGEYPIRTKHGVQLYYAFCTECGYVSAIRGESIKSGGNQKCTHRLVRTHWDNKRIKTIMAGMKARCYCETEPAYPRYGANGIKICDEWMKNPKSFEIWANENGYADNLTIDRIDPTKGYCPENCRWVTREMNAKWKSNTVPLTIYDETDSESGWAVKAGMTRGWFGAMKNKHGYEYTKKKLIEKLNDINYFGNNV